MMTLTLTKTDEGEWLLNLDNQAMLTMDLGGMEEMRDLLNRAIASEAEGV